MLFSAGNSSINNNMDCCTNICFSQRRCVSAVQYTYKLNSRSFENFLFFPLSKYFDTLRISIVLIIKAIVTTNFLEYYVFSYFFLAYKLIVRPYAKQRATSLMMIISCSDHVTFLQFPSSMVS